MMRRLGVGVFGLGMVLLSAGCATKQEGPQACTRIGCESGLSVTIRGDRGGDVTVKVASAEGVVREFQCDGDARDCTAFFGGYMPDDNVTITVTKQEGSVVRAVPVTYRDVQPNGEDCPPVCRQGQAELTL